MILGLSSPLQHASADTWAKRMSELGCRAVVFPVSCESSESVIHQYVEAAHAYNLVIAEVGIWKNVLSPNKDESKKAFDYAVGQLRLADAIGAKCCVNIAGTPKGPKWDGGYKENFSLQTWKETVKVIQCIIDEVKPTRTKFSIESMPWMIPSSPDEYVQLINDVDRTEFGVHLDIVNMINCPKRFSLTANL